MSHSKKIDNDVFSHFVHREFMYQNHILGNNKIFMRDIIQSRYKIFCNLNDKSKTKHNNDI